MPSMTYDIDIESLLNEPMQPWQSSLIKAIDDKVKLGVKPGELTVFTSGRATGKSTLNYLHSIAYAKSKLMPKFEILESAVVDGSDWHTIKCSAEVARWIRTTNKSQWHEHVGQTSYIDDRDIFDMDARLYTILQLKF